MSSVTFQSGSNADEMVKLRTVEVESRSAGWINCPVIGNIVLHSLNYSIELLLTLNLYFRRLTPRYCRP